MGRYECVLWIFGDEMKMVSFSGNNENVSKEYSEIFNVSSANSEAKLLKE